MRVGVHKIIKMHAYGSQPNRGIVGIADQMRTVHKQWPSLCSMYQAEGLSIFANGLISRCTVTTGNTTCQACRMRRWDWWTTWDQKLKLATRWDQLQKLVTKWGRRSTFSDLNLNKLSGQKQKSVRMKNVRLWRHFLHNGWCNLIRLESNSFS